MELTHYIKLITESSYRVKLRIVPRTPEFIFVRVSTEQMKTLHLYQRQPRKNKQHVLTSVSVVFWCNNCTWDFPTRLINVQNCLFTFSLLVLYLVSGLFAACSELTSGWLALKWTAFLFCHWFKKGNTVSWTNGVFIKGACSYNWKAP